MEESTPAEQTPAPKQFKRGKVDLLNGPIDSTLRTFAIPLAFSFLVNMLYSWIDTYFVSRLGASAIAAIGVSEQLGFIIFTFGSGFAIGSGIIISRRIGEGDRHGANHTATQSVIFMLIFSLLMVLCLYASLDTLLNSMNFEPQVRDFMRVYLSVLIIGIPGNYITFLINSIVRSTGNSVFPMMILLMSTVINAILAPILIFGVGPIPALGIAGAGWATGSAQLIGGAISISMLISGKTGIKLLKEQLTLDIPLIWKIVKQGFPAFLQMCSVSFSRFAILTFAGSYGTSIVTAYTLGLRVDLFVFMTVFALGIAVETATGQNLGAGNIKRVFLFHRSAIKQVVVAMAVLATAVFLFGDHFAGIFTNDAAIIRETTRYLHTAVFGYIFFGVGLVTTRVISGAGASFRSMVIVGGSLIFLQVPLAYSLSQYTDLGPQGIWFGVVGGYILFTGIAFIELSRKKWLNARV